MISKVIHQIWLGDNKIPDKCLEYSSKLKSMYYDFEYKFWTGYNEDCVTGDMIYKCSNMGAVSDIARLEILYKYGGIYFDIDIEPLYRADWITDNEIWGVKQNAGIANCIIGAKKDSPAILDILESLVRSKERVENLRPYNTRSITGPEMVTRVFCSRSDVTIFGKPIWEKYFKHHSLRTWVNQPQYLGIKFPCCGRKSSKSIGIDDIGDNK